MYPTLNMEFYGSMITALFSGFDSQTRRHIHGLCLLILFSAPTGFSPGTTPVFPSPPKSTFDLI